MKKTYQVTISFFDPYPVTSEYRIETSNIGRACQEAYKQLKKERKGKREPKSLAFKSIFLSNDSQTQPTTEEQVSPEVPSVEETPGNEPSSV
jgi:hypothetical protein